MAEEHACLVRARSDSEASSKHSFGTMTYTEDRLSGTESGGGEPGNGAANNASAAVEHPAEENENGELLDYNDSNVLEQFHDDALRQAGCGISQARVMLAVGLAIAGAFLELAAIPFILPSAEIELCILPHEKNWLVMISLVGGSLGALVWGALSQRLGRRRALLSCLAVNAVFAAIAAFMPTYGTFMMARFCSAIGSGGILPISYAYAGEMWWRARRRPALALLALAAAIGTAMAPALAAATLPQTGATTLIENKEHFSAWHRYLLLCTLPILASLVSLIWTQESPRYLLDVGREVDAMMVYQSIHSSNHIRICGKAGVGATTEPEYRLGELALPGKRRPPAVNHVRHGVKMLWQSFFELFSPAYWTYTWTIGGTLFFSMAIQYYLSAFIPATVVQIESKLYEASKRSIDNESYTDVQYNTTMENVVYFNVTFDNCTLRDMLMSHVAFQNCSFYNVALSNIKTSFTTFEGCLFVNSTIIDTDMEIGRELDEWCIFNSTVIRGMRGGCARHADLTSHLGGLTTEQIYVSHAMLLAALICVLPHYFRPVMGMCGACVFLSPFIHIAKSETWLYVVEAVFRLLLSLVFFGLSVDVVKYYPHHLRCIAHGLILSLTYMGGAIVRGLGDTNSVLSLMFVAFLGFVALMITTYANVLL